MKNEVNKVQRKGRSVFFASRIGRHDSKVKIEGAS